MSPSESQLRAALQQGEGSGPNPDMIIGAARKLQRERRETRTRIATAIAAVVVLGGVGVGITRHNDTRQTAAADRATEKSGTQSLHSLAGGTNAAGAGGGAVAGGPLAPAAGSVPSPGNPVANFGAGNNGPCPATPVRYLLPGGGGTDQFGSSSPIVGKPVSSLTFCVYDATASTSTFLGSQLLDGTAAQEFVSRVEAGTTRHDPSYCLAPRSVEIIPVGTDGKGLTPLSVVGGCQQVTISNGTAVRYLDVSALDAVTTGPNVLATPPPSGVMSGSPAR